MNTARCAVNALLTCIALHLFCIEVRGQGEVRILLQNGPNARRLNIVYLAEGYTELQKSQFFDHAEQLRQYSLAVSPYDSYARHFNVYAIFVPSTESGSDHPSRGVYHDTYFNSTYDTYGIARLVTLTGDGYAKVLALLATSVPECDFPVVIVNDSEYGGSGGSISVTSTHPSAGEIVVHEQGHTFAGLADEYESAYPGWTPAERANSTSHTQLGSIVWRDWIDPLTPIPTPETQTYQYAVGLFEGCQYQTTGWYRPRLDCKMRNLYVAFCEVCSESHIVGFYNAVSPIDSTYPAESLVTVNIPDSIRLSVSLVEPIQHSLEITWKLNGSTISGASGATLALASEDLGTGTFTFEVEVADTTSRVRNVTLEPELRSTHTWAVNVQPATAVVTLSVLLEGCYNPSTDVMENELRTTNVLASHFPGRSIPVNAVDSINVELRNDTSSTASIRRFRPVWLLTDGTIRDFADTTKMSVEFGAPSGDYFVVVRHRSHLPIMSAAPRPLTSAGTLVEFTESASSAFGVSPMKLVGTRYCMIAGDVDANGGLGASDLVRTRVAIGSVEYMPEDVDMNGGVGASDLVMVRVNIGQASEVP
jgi:hypothetical protein